MTRPYILGHHCGLYYVPYAQRSDTIPGTWANMVASLATSTTFVLVSNIGDVTVDPSGDTVDFPTRAGNGFKQSINAMKGGDITFQMVWTPESQICQDFMRANITGCPIAVCALDGRITYNEGGGLNTDATHPFSPCDTASYVMGLWADFACKMPQNQPLTNLVTVDVTLTPTIGDISPEWVSYPTALTEDWN